MAYKITVIKSVLGNYYWELSNGRKLAESNMISSKDMCMKSCRRLANKLECQINYLDLANDWEE